MEALTIKAMAGIWQKGKAPREIGSDEMLEMEQMLDRGDAVIWKLSDKYTYYTHWLTTRLGSTYLVKMEVEDVRPDPARAYGLLQEALDWIGVIHLSPREEILSHDLQRRIARLLAEVRECTE